MSSSGLTPPRFVHASPTRGCGAGCHPPHDPWATAHPVCRRQPPLSTKRDGLLRRWRQAGGETSPLRPASRVRARIRRWSRRWSRSTGPGHRSARSAARVRRHRADHEEVGSPAQSWRGVPRSGRGRGGAGVRRRLFDCRVFSPDPRRAEARARVRSRQTQARWLVPGRREGGSSHDWATGWPGDTGSTAPANFRALYGPVFTAEPVALFNSGFLMRKRDTNAREVPIAVSRRHT